MNKQRKAKAFCDLARQYNAFETHNGVVEKTFNRGMGSLSLYRFHDDNKVIVNTLIERSSDRTRLLKFMPNADIVEKELGYPDWYSKSLH